MMMMWMMWSSWWNDWQGKLKFRENLPQCRFVHHLTLTGAQTWAAAVGSWQLTS
jgi:hypothetical protein